MADKIQAATVSAELNAQLETLRARLPFGYRIEMGGSIEESANPARAPGAPTVRHGGGIWRNPSCTMHSAY